MLAVFIVVGFLIVLVHLCGAKALSALLRALACLLSGAVIGFLFGIPRVLQSDAATAVEQPAGEPNEDTREATRRKALDAIGHTLAIDKHGLWQKRLQTLIQKNLDKAPGDDDLEVFERDPELRKLPGLT